MHCIKTSGWCQLCGNTWSIFTTVAIWNQYLSYQTYIWLKQTIIKMQPYLLLNYYKRRNHKLLLLSLILKRMENQIYSLFLGPKWPNIVKSDFSNIKLAYYRIRVNGPYPSETKMLQLMISLLKWNVPTHTSPKNTNGN